MSVTTTLDLIRSFGSKIPQNEAYEFLEGIMNDIQYELDKEFSTPISKIQCRIIDFMNKYGMKLIKEDPRLTFMYEDMIRNRYINDCD
jgi:hypothetical protein